MKKEVTHEDFTLWVNSIDHQEDSVPVLYFDEGTSYDLICLNMLALEKLGISCYLTCDTWSTIEEVEIENND